MTTRTAAATLAFALSWMTSAYAEIPAIFKGANLKNGQSLIAEHNCTQCHAGKVGGDGSAIYNPRGRINTAGYLRGMVEQCNVTLNLQMFPEDVTDIAAVLNREHYKFKE
jgi:hypothetical protein